MSFETDFDGLVKKKLDYLHKVRNIATLELGSKIIEDTPVLTGALKGSWRSALGTPSADTSERIDGSGEIPKAELKTAIEAWPEEGSLFMSNHQKYSEGVEFDSWSTQRPSGMVRINIAGRTDFADLTTGTGRTE